MESPNPQPSQQREDDPRKDGDGHDASSSSRLEISEQGVHQLLSQMMKLGYFHGREADGKERISQDEDNNLDDSLEAFRKWQSRHSASPGTVSTFSWDGYCQVVPTVRRDRYYTQEGLVKTMIKRLEQHSGGRAPVQVLCRDLDVDLETFFLSTLPSLTAQSESSHHIPHHEGISLWKCLPESITVLKQGGEIELVSTTYWENLRDQVVSQVKEKGSLQILELSRRYSLPLDMFLSKVASDLPNDSVTLMGDSKCLVSDSYLRNLQTIVLDYFHSLEEPTQIYGVCQEHGWDFDQVLEWLLCKGQSPDEQSHGEVHVDATTSQTAMYLPSSYRERRKQEVLDFVVSNGYIMADRARDMMSLVLETFPDAFVIEGKNGDDDRAVILDQILEEVKVGIQEYFSSSTSAKEILDLQEYLPVDLLQPAYVPSILEEIGLTSDRGMAVAGNEQIVVVSKQLIQHVKDKHLPILVEEFAKIRAEELLQAASKRDEEEEADDDPNLKSGKAKLRRGGKRSKQKKSTNNESKSHAIGLVPLTTVANTIVNEYSCFQTSNDLPDSIDWEDDDENDNENCGDLVVNFCRKALLTDAFREQCERAVNAELQRLHSERHSKAKLSRKDAAAKVRSVDAAFEDVFATLCYLIQAQSKFINFASGSSHFDEESIDVLRSEFLQGPCAELTSRITQQCLFKEEQDCVFTFTPLDEIKTKDPNKKEQTGQASLPPHCSEVDITARHRPRVYLSCPGPRDPLNILRESFSGNAGVALARQWTICGRECYRGGVQKSVHNDDECSKTEVVQIRPGNIDGFLPHVEENCLTLCGLPFKKLDKKSEKNFLFSRKQQLSSLLSAATEASDILDFTVMILFQQVRQLVVSGSLLRGPILDALTEEKKIPSSVAKAMKRLNNFIQNGAGTNMDDKILGFVKECGLARDITKHDTAGLEAYVGKD